MKFKDFRESSVFAEANICKYYEPIDPDGNFIEIEPPTNEVKWRSFLNREVTDHGTMIENGLAVLEIYLK